MNVNKDLITILKNATGFDVAQDEYEGKADKYIVFVYSDERPAFWSDNSVLADTVYLQIQLITPKKYNYFAKKTAIRDALEKNGYFVTSINSFLDDSLNGEIKNRRTVFEVNYTEMR